MLALFEPHSQLWVDYRVRHGFMLFPSYNVPSFECLFIARGPHEPAAKPVWKATWLHLVKYFAIAVLSMNLQKCETATQLAWLPWNQGEINWQVSISIASFRSTSHFSSIKSQNSLSRHCRNGLSLYDCVNPQYSVVSTKEAMSP